MNNISRTLKRWVQNGNMTLDGMAHKVFERGWSEYRVLTYDELKEHTSSRAPAADGTVPARAETL